METAPTAQELTKALAKKEILIGAFGERRIRIVTHLDVNAQSGEVLITELAKHLDRWNKNKYVWASEIPSKRIAY